MKQEYIITEQELNERGIAMSDYFVDTTAIYPVINMMVGKIVTRIFKLNDNFKCEEDIEKDLQANPYKISAFKKLQFTAIYNLIFVGDNDPLDASVNDIIVHDLKWGKINGFQKGWR